MGSDVGTVETRPGWVMLLDGAFRGARDGAGIGGFLGLAIGLAAVGEDPWIAAYATALGAFYGAIAGTVIGLLGAAIIRVVMGAPPAAHRLLIARVTASIPVLVAAGVGAAWLASNDGTALAIALAVPVVAGLAAVWWETPRIAGLR